MGNFYLSNGLVILVSLACALLNRIRQVSCRFWLVAGFVVTSGACFGGGTAFWPWPTLPATGWPIETLVCLVETVADGRRVPLVWTVEPSPGGLEFVLPGKLACPRSELRGVDRKW